MTASVDPTRAITEEEPCEFSSSFLFPFCPLLFPFFQFLFFSRRLGSSIENGEFANILQVQVNQSKQTTNLRATQFKDQYGNPIGAFFTIPR